MEEEVALIAEEEWDRRDKLEDAQEDPALNEWPDWDPKTHSIEWVILHDYVQIPYG